MKEQFVKKWQAKYEIHPTDLGEMYEDLVATLITDAEAFDDYRGKLWSTAIQKCWEAPFPLVAMQYLLQRVYAKAKEEALQAKELLK
jgi:hypothetical protein